MEPVPNRSSNPNRRKESSDTAMPAYRQCQGSPNGHNWDKTESNSTGIVCTKCGMRGRGR